MEKTPHEELYKHGRTGANTAFKSLPIPVQDRLHKYAKTENHKDYEQKLSSSFSNQHPEIVKKVFPKGVPTKLSGEHTTHYRNIGREFGLRKAVKHLLNHYTFSPTWHDKIKKARSEDTGFIMGPEDLRTENVKNLLSYINRSGTPVKDIHNSLVESFKGTPIDKIKEKFGNPKVAKLFQQLYEHMTRPDYGFNINEIPVAKN